MIYKEGDIIQFTHKDEIYLQRILIVDLESQTYHVTTYGPLKKVPQNLDLPDLPIAIKHAPIAIKGFESEKGTLIKNIPIDKKELDGFYYYLKLTDFNRYLKETGQDVKKVVHEANQLYREANQLAEAGKRIEAIDKYSRVLDVFPAFFEALDNRAFTKMELSQYKEAISDFEESLRVNPDAITATFSVGECYLKIGAYDNALNYFNKCLMTNPNHEASKIFIKKTKRLKKVKRQQNDGF
jgi:tetratricopeptide (TPR) repeat protein